MSVEVFAWAWVAVVSAYTIRLSAAATAQALGGAGGGLAQCVQADGELQFQGPVGCAPVRPE